MCIIHNSWSTYLVLRICQKVVTDAQMHTQWIEEAQRKWSGLDHFCNGGKDVLVEIASNFCEDSSHSGDWLE